MGGGRRFSAGVGANSAVLPIGCIVGLAIVVNCLTFLFRLKPQALHNSSERSEVKG